MPKGPGVLHRLSQKSPKDPPELLKQELDMYELGGLPDHGAAVSSWRSCRRARYSHVHEMSPDDSNCVNDAVYENNWDQYRLTCMPGALT